MKPLTPRDKRTIRIGATILFPVLLWTFGVRPWRASLSDARDQLEVARQALARERGAVATAQRNPELQHMTDSVLHAIEPRLFEGRDDVMATSELAAYIGDLAFQNHVWVQDASTRPATSPTPGVRMLRVEIRAESDFQGVLAFFQDLEQGDRLVRIERIDLARAMSSPENEKAETLTLTATIAGYAMGNINAPPNKPAPSSVTKISAGGQ